ncbi:hypothetical protein [Actinoplanes sp. NPDC049265]|uniref:hypothetical protein n=1 Tax=Actinoplanes sp. NPDC049265 TaxID=3363902 RepID=UPI00372083E8
MSAAFRRARPWTVTAVVVLGLAAVLIVRSAGPPTAGIPDNVGGFAAAGNVERSIFPDAPAYAATGPHPTAVLVSSAGTYEIRSIPADGEPRAAVR